MTKRLIVACLLLAHGALAQTPAPVPLEERLAKAALANRHMLVFDGKTFAGPAWDMLWSEGQSSQFFALGEEHGIAENPKLATALFRALAPAGYSRVVIEVSPPMARELDRAARGGLEGLQKMFARPGGEPAFFGMKEEAEWLAAARAASNDAAPVFWGVDYEVGGDRLLISLLEQKNKPAAAETALAALRSASSASWAQYDTTHNPQFIYSFSGDPALVRAVRDAWPVRDAETNAALDALENTFEINKLWVARKGYESNLRRSTLIRRNFIAYWQAEKRADRTPRVFAKLGASHLTRGRNMTETFDLGTLLPELAALEGSKSFHLLVLPGANSKVAQFNPAAWKYEPQAVPKDNYGKGLAPILNAAFPDAFTLIDLRPLRPLLGTWREGSTTYDLMRTVHGFDAILIMSGSTPSADLD